MSLLCQVPLHESPEGVEAIFLCSDSSRMLIPLWRERVASRLRVLSPSQL